MEGFQSIISGQTWTSGSILAATVGAKLIIEDERKVRRPKRILSKPEQDHVTSGRRGPSSFPSVTSHLDRAWYLRRQPDHCKRYPLGFRSGSRMIGSISRTAFRRLSVVAIRTSFSGWYAELEVVGSCYLILALSKRKCSATEGDSRDSPKTELPRGSEASWSDIVATHHRSSVISRIPPDH